MLQEKIKRILCTTDFSDASNNAIECAALFAKRTKSELTLWNMHELPLIEDFSSNQSSPNHVISKRQEMHLLLQEWCDEIKTEFNINCTYSLDEKNGSLEKTIDHYISGKNYDLIVSGTNGADTLYQYYFGSNSYRIIQKVKCPVLVIPEVCNCKNIVHILFSTDLEHEDISVLKLLKTLFDTTVTSVHFSQTSEEQNEAFKQFKRNAEQDDKGFEFHWINTENSVQSLREQIIKNDTDLLVLTRKNRNYLDEWIHQSFTEEVLKELEIPLLVFNM